jgi:transposase InsO family protein
LFGKTRQAYYEQLWHQETNDLEQMAVVQQVIQIRKQLPGVGTRKLYHLLTGFLVDHHINLGRDKLFELLRQHHLLRHRRRKRALTTNSQHPFYKYGNLIKELSVTHSNELWVSDITYIRTGNAFSYLSLITDAYSHLIVGWALDPTLQTKGPLSALQMALKFKGKGKKTLIHHSDRGLQYCCQDYIKLLSTNEIRISMTEQGDPGENAVAERVNGIIKEEFNCRAFITFDLAQAAIAKAIQAYNQLRPHASCDFLTPAQAHLKEGPIKKRWKKSDRESSCIEGFYRPKTNRILTI